MSHYAEMLVSEDRGEELHARGFKSADLHVHSHHSPCVPGSPALSPRELYRLARRSGLDFIAITDHDNIESHSDLAGCEGFVPGVEIKIKDRERVGHTLHINVYELDRYDFVELESIAGADSPDLEAFVTYCRGRNLPYVYNHPFWFEPSDERVNLKAIPGIIREYFPVVEYNMHRVRRKNLLAAALADRFGRGIVVNTDTHIGDVGRVRSLARGETFREFYDSLARREAFLVNADLSLKNLLQEGRQYLTLFRSMPPSEVFEFLSRGALKDYPALARFIRSAYDRVTGRSTPQWVGRWLYSPDPYAFFIWLYVTFENTHGRLMRRELAPSLARA